MLVARTFLRYSLTVIVVMALSFYSTQSRAQILPVVGEGAITTAEIDAISTALMGVDECVDYCIVGVCVTLFGVVPKISHRYPDFVVSTHLHPGESAWLEMAALLYIPARAVVQAYAALLGFPWLVDGGQNITRKGKKRPAIRGENNQRKATKHVFNGDTVVIGNSAFINPAFLTAVSQYPFTCPISTVPFLPYYQSEFDLINWRLGLSDLFYPESYIPGAREIGSMEIFPLGNTWGSVMPRISATIAQEPPLGAGVLAQRGVDIVTRPAEPRIYIPASGVEPSDEKKDKWAMMKPFADPICEPFGSVDPLYSTLRYADDHKYSYLYWGAHECCSSLFSIGGFDDTIPVCL